jgi:hypothetical protein
MLRFGVKKMTLKKILSMVVIMFSILFLYFVFSGVFSVHSSYRDVLTMSQYDEIATGDNWEIYVPESNDNNLSPYFKYNGSMYPQSNIHIKAVIYLKEGNIEQVEWYPYSDRYFFFGEERYYFPEDYNNIQNIACKIVWNEYNNDQNHISYVFSNNLNENNKLFSLEYIDTIDINENNNYKYH